MITRVALLFLFGTTISSSQFMSKQRSLPYEIAALPNAPSSGCPAASELAPLICKLIQQNIDLFFKPKLIEPSTYIPPIYVEKCDTPQLQMNIDLPAPVPEPKPLVIPQPPELPPMTIPQFPVPVIIEEPHTSVEPCESSGILQIPAVNIPVASAIPPMEMPILPQIVEEPKPVEPEIYYTPVEIPQPPELPVFTMPDLPVIVEPAQPIIAAPCPEQTLEPIIHIPAVPELPPVNLPDFPIYFDIPSGPVLPPTEVNLPEINNNFIEYEPISVPQPPELPAFVMPELPVLIAEQEQPTIVEPCIEEKPAPVVSTPEYIQPVAIPQPPELPEFFMPELPVQDMEQNQPIVNEPCFEDKPAPVVTIPDYIQPVVIPQPPELPAFVMPELPIQVIEQKLPSIAEPYLEDKAAPVVPIPEYIQPVVAIPQPPELPEFVMPELPIQVLAQSHPIIAKAEPCLEDKPAPVVPIPEYIQPVVAIPQPPELPEFIMPELPVQVLEQSHPIIAKAEPCLEDKPEPVVPIPEYIQPVVAIPQPPELPEFIMPELPVQVLEQSHPIIAKAEPCLEDKPAPGVPIPEFIQPLVAIPQPPELPQFVMPELPVQVLKQNHPIIAEPCPEDNPTPVMPIPQYVQPVAIPQPPELPAFVMPELPVHLVEPELPVAPTPCLEDHPAPIVTIPEFIQSLPTIPVAPELPSVKLPEFPVHVEIPTGPVLPPTSPKEPCATEELGVRQAEQISIPKAPKLPGFIMPDFPLKITIAEPTLPQPTFVNEPCEPSGKPVIPVATIHKHNPYFGKYYPSYASLNNEKVKESHKSLVPSKQIVPHFFPARSAYNLVMEHVIPNIASDRFRSLQNIDILPPPVLPCP